MGKINILDSAIFNRIAAGEVVERPSSVVKELLDNSIDAGASKITVEVKNGGIEEIKVSDNGCGIEEDDFDKVFLAHATSKIKTVDDLEKIGTLGFRGEALASISAVAEVELVSKTNSSDLGYVIRVANGAVGEKSQIGTVTGTALTVSNLFYNVPARSKFLKKPRTEASEITNLVSRYILANPDVSIKYILDGNEVYFSTGNGLLEAIYTVYGKESADNIILVSYTSKSGIKVSGYIGKPTYTKPNRTYQTLIINGRYVVNSMVSLCVYNAFENYLMKGQFPFFVLNLDIPLSSLDVNVHPNKMDVRFENGNEIYGVIYSALSETLLNAKTVSAIQRPVFEYERADSGLSFSEGRQNQGNEPKTVDILSGKKSPALENSPENNGQVQQLKEGESGEDTNYHATKFYQSLNQKSESMFSQNSSILSNIYEKKLSEEMSLSTQNQQQEFFNAGALKFIGTLFLTYLLVEREETVYIIDQHAAHERLLYDKLTSQINSKTVNSQYLLVPYTFTVNSLENEFLKDNGDKLREIGFHISAFGSLTYKISAIPQLLAGVNLKAFISGLLSELSVFKGIKQGDLIMEKLLQHSCKTAVKAGDSLSENEVNALLDRIKSTNMQLQCPHGRPIIVELSKKELEKWFKRVM